MAKGEVWVVRTRRAGLMGGLYRMTRGPKPSKNKRGDWPRQKVCEYWCEVLRFEGIFPKCYHLKPGGGPVLIEFKETSDGEG